MKLYHVVAMASNRVIGKNNQLPWHFSSDLKHFKELTMGQTILMGRKTFESIGKPLPGRENFVLTSKKQGQVQEGKTDLSLTPVRFFSFLEEALQNVKTEHCFIIGGGQLFTQTIREVDGIYLTKIQQPFEGDIYYPAIPNFFVEEGTRKNLQENPRIEVIFYKNRGKG